MSELTFKPYIYTFIDENDELYSNAIIALYRGVFPVKLTTYQRFVGDTKRTKHMYSQNQDEVRRVCNFLNYVLIDYYVKYKAKSLSEIPFQAVVDYIYDYAITKTRFNDYPSEQSVMKERNAVCMFMHNLSEDLKKKDHYYTRKIKSSVIAMPKTRYLTLSKRKETTIWEYEIPVNYRGKHEYRLVRDIPQKAIGSILKWVNLIEPELYFAVVLQLSAGLREGEAVNVRRTDSIYPTGIRIVKENGKIISFEIDLTRVYSLRSDGVLVGDIKRKRMQQVYPPFLPIVQKAYEQHLRLMELKTLEEQKPMFVCTRKKKKIGCNLAITKKNYCDRISNVIVKYVVPELINSSDPELVAFAMAVTEGSWGLHAFRHWFTVQLVLNDEDANSIAFWRGDSSTKTAFWYLQNKGILMKKYTNITNIVTDDIMKVISEMEIE